MRHCIYMQLFTTRKHKCEKSFIRRCSCMTCRMETSSHFGRTFNFPTRSQSHSLPGDGDKVPDIFLPTPIKLRKKKFVHNSYPSLSNGSAVCRADDVLCRFGLVNDNFKTPFKWTQWIQSGKVTVNLPPWPKLTREWLTLASHDVRKC